jgi:hypothetical protein
LDVNRVKTTLGPQEMVDILESIIRKDSSAVARIQAIKLLRVMANEVHGPSQFDQLDEVAARRRTRKTPGGK